MQLVWPILGFLLSLTVLELEGRKLIVKFGKTKKHSKANFTDVTQAPRNGVKVKMAPKSKADGNIIYLNVGGQRMATKRSTLRQFNGSSLATMFTRRGASRLMHDKDGRIFLDFNPKYFSLILNYLRAKKFESAEDRATMPKIPRDQAKDFNRLVRYLGLENNLRVKTDFFDFKFHSSGVSIEDDGAMAKKGSVRGHEYVLGVNTYKDEVIRWRLKLESFQHNHWIYVGILKSDTKPSGHRSFNWFSSYGWAIGDSGQVFTNGKVSYDTNLSYVCKQGDTVELVLDCREAKLSLFMPAGQDFHHTLPTSATWKLHVNLYGAHDQIRIV